MYKPGAQQSLVSPNFFPSVIEHKNPEGSGSPIYYPHALTKQVCEGANAIRHRQFAQVHVSVGSGSLGLGCQICHHPENWGGKHWESFDSPTPLRSPPGGDKGDPIQGCIAPQGNVILWKSAFHPPFEEWKEAKKQEAVAVNLSFRKRMFGFELESETALRTRITGQKRAIYKELNDELQHKFGEIDE
ncbi:uncharacterized protein EI90DRAFT_3016976 [Cantharellus anzutake]|uniref:uncharacterized protein n=1 Tax=Cantharellus anzutake TaxID=1750568 RepID=UPI001906241D|nr:uncharacterized protein EI90DRAFT_3016976 [Cantharellus anzutake]KAF8330048.1 hypothetical protein EI90DRAFT_3016976 [Cantharellus anzutake]